MTLQNRVSPFGTFHAVPDRGAWMGNRGILHGGARLRPYAHKAWITCALSFKGRKRALMQPGSYTELFFLDEATSYAAGHRPCAECRRADYRAFTAHWAGAHGAAKAAEIDACLHGQRLPKDRIRAGANSLPDGTMVAHEGQAVLIWRGLWDWSFAGYTPRAAITAEVTLLTPPAIVALYRAGLTPQVHPSAG